MPWAPPVTSPPAGEALEPAPPRLPIGPWQGRGGPYTSGVMHEFGIMQEMARIAVEQAEAAEAERVHVIRLRVGRLAGVVPEAMQFAHEVVVEGTIAEGSRLEIETAPIRCYCESCRKEFETDQTLFQCPDCGAVSRDVRGGRELEMVNMEVS